MRTLHLKQQSGTVVYCGRTMSKEGSQMEVNQVRSTLGLDYLRLDQHWKARIHERRNHWIAKSVGTVVVVGTAVAT